MKYNGWQQNIEEDGRIKCHLPERTKERVRTQKIAFNLTGFNCNFFSGLISGSASMSVGQNVTLSCFLTSINV